jgi:threonine aldolase
MDRIDLRSDTVTQPTTAMWEAMRRARLGDDVLGDEPTVRALERKVARLLGKEEALFVPSGTMANQIAIRCHCRLGDEIIAHRESHVVHYETGAPAGLSGCMVRPLDGLGGLFTAQACSDGIRGGDVHAPRSRLIIVENTHNRGGGTVWPLAQLRDVAKVARRARLALHIDGARLWNASVAAGYSPADFVRDADSVSVCFSKGLGAPVGSALAGSRAVIAEARRVRKMFGGGMRQSGLLAAAAMYALDHHIDRLAVDHRRARQLGRVLARIRGIRVNPAPSMIATNMVFFELSSANTSAAEFCRRLARLGVKMIAMGPHRVRAVVHLDVPEDVVERTAKAVAMAVRQTR